MSNGWVNYMGLKCNEREKEVMVTGKALFTTKKVCTIVQATVHLDRRARGIKMKATYKDFKKGTGNVRPRGAIINDMMREVMREGWEGNGHLRVARVLLDASNRARTSA